MPTHAIGPNPDSHGIAATRELHGSLRGGARISSSELLMRISAAVSSAENLVTVLELILAETMDAIGAQEGSILLHDVERDRLEMLASRGLPDEIRRRGHIPREGGIADWVMTNNRPQILNGAVKRNRPYKAGPDARVIHSAMCLPLRARGRVIGTINLNRTDEETGNFSAGDMKLLTIVTAHIAESIDLARRQDERLRAERLAAIGETITGVAHCIKNLLTTLDGGLMVCRNAVESGDRDMYARGHGVLERAVKRVSSLSLDMLEFARERRPLISRVRIGKAFDELIQMKSEATRTDRVEMTYAIGPGAEYVETDEASLFRCLLNLVDNAFHACGAGGRVTLTAEVDRSVEATRRLPRHADRAVVVRVTDNGPGVLPGLTESIFEPFFSTKGSRGTGLGLAVTAKLVRESGGDIAVESKPGCGATFLLYLPAADSR